MCIRDSIVAGNKRLGLAVRSVCDNILEQPRDKDQFLKDAKSMWTLIESQRITNTSLDHFNSKLRPGGLMQAEYTQNCYRLLGLKAPHIEESILFWSNLQLWERLLGLTGHPLTDIPEVYKPNVQAQFKAKRLSGIASLQSKHTKHVLAAYNKLFEKITLPRHYESARILWTDR